MKKMRLHIYIVIAIFVIGFIVGSFLDYQINSAIFSNKNVFGLILSVIGTIPGYGMFGVLGGGCLAIALKKQYNKIVNIFLIGAYVVFVGLGIYFSGREFFGPNGFTNESIKFVGYLIMLPVILALGYLGYFLFKNSDKKYLLPLVIVLSVAIFIALIPGVTILKSTFNRPRYRSIVLYEDAGLTFHHWWEPCKNYKDYMESFSLIKEEFKSFPSGHAGASFVFALVVSFLPRVNMKYEKLSLILFYVGLGWTLLISFSRLLVGAHFLSDVSMGGLITSICLLAANEVVIGLKMFKEEEQQLE